MDEKVLTAVIGAVAGLISGSIASIVAPWINWGIEKRKQKLAHRRELIAKWRAMVFHIVSVYESDEETDAETFFDLLAKEQDYLSLKPHISDEAYKKLLKADITPGEIIIVQRGALGSGSSRVNPIGGFASLLADEVTRIEKEWKLI